MSQIKLELHDIQGDVLIGLQKDYELFYFFEIKDISAFKSALRGQIASRITSCLLAQAREQHLNEIKKRGGAKQRLPLHGLNTGFTATGLKKLIGASAEGLEQAFVDGAAKRAKDLNDPVGKDCKPLNWDGLKRETIGTGISENANFDGDRVDGVFLFTGPDVESVVACRDEIYRILAGSITEVYQEIGHVRAPQRGHEHFGFLDGVSQPGIRGVDTASDPVGNPKQGLPGQDLLWPGEFVFGYTKQPTTPETDISKPGKCAEPPHEWMHNGSYMVFRRLKQLVPEFNAFVDDTAENLGLDRELLGARLVGRWKSGTPIIISPLQDDPALGADETRNNHFEYGGDAGARRCPFGAHIRKAYPRDDLNEAGGSGEIGVQQHRIKRAGIPFGPEVKDVEENETKFDRGLMFVCYQTSIEKQFEFVQKQWVNNAHFPNRDDPDNAGAKPREYPNGDLATPGHDPLIGQSASTNRARTFEELVPNHPTGDKRTSCSIPKDFVIPTAAGYFFMPSISALVSTLSS